MPAAPLRSATRATRREVALLAGRAFFDVVAAKDRPFVVVADDYHRDRHRHGLRRAVGRRRGDGRGAIRRGRGRAGRWPYRLRVLTRGERLSVGHGTGAGHKIADRPARHRRLARAPADRRWRDVGRGRRGAGAPLCRRHHRCAIGRWPIGASPACSTCAGRSRRCAAVARSQHGSVTRDHTLSPGDLFPALLRLFPQKFRLVAFCL